MVERREVIRSVVIRGISMASNLGFAI